MSITTISDLAQTFMQRSIGNRLHRDLTTLNLELTTGMKRDVAKAVGGKTGPVAAIERALTRADAQGQAVKEAAIFADAAGIALHAMSSRIEDVSLGATTLDNGTSELQISVLASSARHAFSAMISDLGTQSGGRPIFAGATGDSAATRPAEDIMASLVASLSGATTSADVITGVNAYFADDGPFQTDDYLGSRTDLAPFDLGDGSNVDVGIRADHPGIREALAEVARVAVLGEEFGLGHKARADTLLSAVTGLLRGKSAVTDLEARVGSGVASIENATVRNETQRDGFRMARLHLLAADPYETATRLQQTEVQISTIYAITARLSGLNLVSFLR